MHPKAGVAPRSRGTAAREPGRQTGRRTMWRLLRGLIYLTILGMAGIAGYAFLGDLSPERAEVRQTVVLDGR